MSHFPQLGVERQLTTAPTGHILANAGVWSHDGQWIVYDIRSDAAGEKFDGDRIERVHVETGEVQVLYESRDGACCGVPTCSPVDDRVVFIHGPERPDADWSYRADHRRGVVLHADRPAWPITLDARDLVSPYTPGALRGGTHLHAFSADGQCIVSTYEDHVLGARGEAGRHESNQRNVAVSLPRGPVRVLHAHPRNHDGSHFTVLVTRTVDRPRYGSDEISRACEEAWVGVDGYVRADGGRQRRAIAFQGDVVTAGGRTIREAFIVDLSDDLTTPGDGPLQGTATTRPCAPRGCAQRRLTFTANRINPGLSGPRHWLRSSPDGERIALLMRDDAGVVQLFTVSPRGGPISQLTHNPHAIGSALTWRCDGRCIAHVMDQSVCITDATTGATRRVTPRWDDPLGPRPEACVFSPDGGRIAYVRRVPDAMSGVLRNQIFTVTCPAD
ncbi:MAG: DUF3748 domain-containing protein [Planctomycetes bacterium]|nr:DUF3748 domain-containing protein [Planctomycetota bacterium]